MPLMPGSPRPGTPAPQEEDDGVYRSLFQQPVVDIPPAAPSYAWFEFLLHPKALQKHVRPQSPLAVGVPTCKLTFTRRGSAS
jgi:hypothetical protein